ncbi:MAG: twin-arginine translocase TatA/TatE family subunit [Bradymonadaceae bacterium]|nr:twin-arginine translocase TatA/TatE family subunit [Lujinxingiaceae bacterium]
MFGISLPELVIIFVLVLVVLGPEKLPEVARWVGKGLREVRRASNLMRDTLMIDDDDHLKHRTRRPRSIERASEASSVVHTPSGVVPDPTKQSSAPNTAATDELDQLDDQAFDQALAQAYQLDGPLRRIALRSQRSGPALRQVALDAQGGAPGCRDVHLAVAQSAEEFAS